SHGRRMGLTRRAVPRHAARCPARTPRGRIPMSATVQITVDAHDPRALSLFWKEVLGYVHPAPPGVELADGEDPLAAWDAFLERHEVPLALRNSSSALEDPDGSGPRVFFQQAPEDKVAKNRLHLDVRTATELRGE